MNSNLLTDIFCYFTKIYQISPKKARPGVGAPRTPQWNYSLPAKCQPTTTRWCLDHKDQSGFRFTGISTQLPRFVQLVLRAQGPKPPAQLPQAEHTEHMGQHLGPGLTSGAESTPTPRLSSAHLERQAEPPLLLNTSFPLSPNWTH